jgi:hypothetical protein
MTDANLQGNVRQMRCYQRQQLGLPRRAHCMGCVLLMFMACVGCRTAAVSPQGCAADENLRHGSEAGAGGTRCFWKFCHVKRVPEVGPTLSPFLPVPTYDVFSGMPMGVKPVAVDVPGSLNESGLPVTPSSNTPIARTPAVPPPALLQQPYPSTTNAAPRPLNAPSQDREARRVPSLPVQLANCRDADTAAQNEAPSEAVLIPTPAPSTLRIRKESLRAETTAPAAE